MATTPAKPLPPPPSGADFADDWQTGPYTWNGPAVIIGAVALVVVIVWIIAGLVTGHWSLRATTTRTPSRPHRGPCRPAQPLSPVLNEKACRTEAAPTRPATADTTSTSVTLHTILRSTGTTTASPASADRRHNDFHVRAKASFH
jgi:hypothetical protein